MSGLPLAVGPGTGVPEDFRVGPIVVSPARKAYAHVLALAEDSHHFPMHRAGLGHLDETYRFQEERWLEYAQGGQINLAVHSQNCLHALRFVVCHRLVVEKAIFINPPFRGATIAGRFRGLACADDMAPNSLFIARFREEIEAGFRRFSRGLKRNPNYHIPECHIMGLKHDRVVDHWSPHWHLRGLAHNHSLGSGARPPVESWVRWHEFDSDQNHFNIIRHHPSLKLFGEILDYTGIWGSGRRLVVSGHTELARAA